MKPEPYVHDLNPVYTPFNELPIEEQNSWIAIAQKTIDDGGADSDLNPVELGEFMYKSSKGVGSSYGYNGSV